MRAPLLPGLIALLLLTACGQRGPLLLPGKRPPAPVAAPAATESPAAAPAAKPKSDNADDTTADPKSTPKA